MFGHRYWRIICVAEDGTHVVSSGFGDFQSANRYLLEIFDDYGEGQSLFVESYVRD